MASPAYERILEIQGLDLSIGQLRHRAATHPLRSELAEIDERLAAHDAEVAEVGDRHHDLERQRKRVEDEVATVEARRRDIDAKLYGGEVTASKELLALQDEAAALLDRQRAMEDDELELMEQIEELSEDLTARASIRNQLEADRVALQAELDGAVAEIEAEIAGLADRRAGRADPRSETVPGLAELLVRYDDLRPQYDGVPVARVVDGRCDGCHIQLSAVAVDRMSRMADDAVVSCEECGRLLVR